MVQGGTGGQNRRALHGSRRLQALAANDQHIAKTAFVTGVATGRQSCRDRCSRVVQPSGGRRAGGCNGQLPQAQIIEPNLARRIAPIGGKQAGFQGQQAQGVALLVAGAVVRCLRCIPRLPQAGVGLQPAGQIHRQNRCRAGIAVLQQGGDAGVGRCLAVQAQAKQGIHNEVVRL